MDPGLTLEADPKFEKRRHRREGADPHRMKLCEPLTGEPHWDRGRLARPVMQPSTAGGLYRRAGETPAVLVGVSPARSCEAPSAPRLEIK
jgi:hypothetical protein